MRCVTNRFMCHDATLGQPQPKPRIHVVDLDSLNETVESLNWPSSVQQANPQIVHQLVTLVGTKSVQRSTRIRFHCEHKRDRHSKNPFMCDIRLLMMDSTRICSLAETLNNDEGLVLSTVKYLTLYIRGHQQNMDNP